jgi:hypothetical protein
MNVTFHTSKLAQTVTLLNFIPDVIGSTDRLCGLVVRVSAYRYTGPGFDSRSYQIF